MGQKIIPIYLELVFIIFIKYIRNLMYTSSLDILLYYYKIIFTTYFEKISQRYSTWIAIYKPHLHFLEEAYSENEIFMCMLEAI